MKVGLIDSFQKKELFGFVTNLITIFNELKVFCGQKNSVITLV